MVVNQSADKLIKSYLAQMEMDGRGKTNVTKMWYKVEK